MQKVCLIAFEPLQADGIHHILWKWVFQLTVCCPFGRDFLTQRTVLRVQLCNVSYGFLGLLGFIFSLVRVAALFIVLCTETIPEIWSSTLL